MDHSLERDPLIDSWLRGSTNPSPLVREQGVVEDLLVLFKQSSRLSFSLCVCMSVCAHARVYEMLLLSHAQCMCVCR